MLVRRPGILDWREWLVRRQSAMSRRAQSDDGAHKVVGPRFAFHHNHCLTER